MHMAYDFVENDKVSTAEMIRALGESTAKAAAGLKRVYVATDGSSISVTDNTGSKKTGRIGTDSTNGVGDKLHAALAIDEDGAPIGVIDLQFWQRAGKSRTKDRDKLPAAAKETQRWLDARNSSRKLLRQYAPGARPHFLHDREADAWPILLDAFEHRETEDSTIRASWDRRLVPTEAGDDETLHLREQLEATKACGEYQLEVSGRTGRKGRSARMVVRTTRVTLRLRDKHTSQIREVPMDVIHAIEVGTTPAKEKPIEWLLYTTQHVETIQGALEVVRHYAFRWRVEEYFFALKTGGSDAESTQLEGDHRERWLIILAAVAARAVRLKYLARTDPERDPSREFDQLEIAVIRAVLREQRRSATRLTLDIVVRAVARLGGYVDQKSNPHPGTQTISNGLRDLGHMVLGARLAGAR
jgi:hypothetical protein